MIVVILRNPNRGPGIKMMIKRIDICVIIRNENLLCKRCKNKLINDGMKWNRIGLNIIEYKQT